LRQRGHGAIQLTWKKNYENFHTWLTNNYTKYNGRNVVTDPTIIDSDKELFVLSGLYFWNSMNINKVIDELSLDDIDDVNKMKTYVKEVTKKINTGNNNENDRINLFKKTYNEIKE